MVVIMNFPGRFIGGLLMVILLLIFPLQYIAGSNSEDIDSLVDGRTKMLTDTIRDKGYLDKQMYEGYVDYLDTTGERYDIEIQDIHPITGEELSHVGVDRDGEYLHTSLGGKTNEHIHSHDEVDTANSLMLTSTSKFSASLMPVNEIQLFVTHTHTDACYDGDKHTHTSQIGSCYTWSGHTHSGNTSSGGACYSPNYHSHSGSSSSGGECYGGKNYHSHSGNSSSGGGCYGGRNYHSHSGSSSSGGGCYGGKNYHSHSSSCYHSHTSSCYHSHTSSCYTRCGTSMSIYQVNPTNSRHSCGGAFYSVVARCGSCGSTSSRGSYCTRCGSMPSAGTCSSSKLTCSKSTISPTCGKSTTSPNCGKTTSTVESYYRNCGKSTSTVESYYRNCGKSTSTVESYYRTCGKTSSTIEGYYLSCTKTGEYKLTCPKTPGEYYKGNTRVYPICNKVVTSITATNPNQTVKKGDSIITTARATYLDGHTGTVTCTSNYNSDRLGAQTVTLTYKGLVGNAKTTGTRTCTVNVNVNLELTSLTVTPTTQTIERYSSPSFTVKANYHDGSSKTLSSSQYSITGFNSRNIATQNVTISYTEGGITKRKVVKVTVTPLKKECPRCHKIYELNHDDTDPGCPYCVSTIIGIEVDPDYVEVTKGQSLPIKVMAVFKNGQRAQVSGWTSNYNSARLGIQKVTVEYGGYAKEITVWVDDEIITCPICNEEYPNSEDNCPVCANKVVSINASPKEITVMEYETIPLTVTAHFADGTSRIVDGWSIDTSTVNSGTYKATISYKGVTDIITLHVLSITSIECPICNTIYGLIENPTGCPVCSKDLIGIEVYLTSGTNLVQLGTNPSIAVILIFRDEHREFATDGYTIEDYDPDVLGIQTITVGYKEFTTTLVIEVVNMLDNITCPNGHVYHKNQDGTDPGCPFCHEGEDIGKIIYFDITYTGEILDSIYSVGAYYFNEGNYITVIVTKKDKSLLYKLQDTFFSTSLLGRKRRYIYGGEVY